MLQFCDILYKLFTDSKSYDISYSTKTIKIIVEGKKKEKWETEEKVKELWLMAHSRFLRDQKNICYPTYIFSTKYGLFVISKKLQ